MRKLDGKVAVITGASKGIGASIAEHLAAEGASVVVNYATSQAGADAVAGRIVAKGGKAIAIRADVSEPGDIGRLFKQTRDSYGKLDILVNNAGVFQFAPLDAVTPEHIRRQFDLNVIGLLLTTQAAVRLIGPEGVRSSTSVPSLARCRRRMRRHTVRRKRQWMRLRFRYLRNSALGKFA